MTPPEPLASLPFWCLWKAIPDGDKFAKVPWQADGAGRLKWGDPANLMAYQKAKDILDTSFGGVGFVLQRNGGLVCIDLDNAIGDDGRPVEGAAGILSRFGSYTEVSPSGKGLHIWLLASIDGKNLPQIVYEGQAVEVFTGAHFVTMTGAVVDGYGRSIEERQTETEAFYKELQALHQKAKLAANVDALEANKRAAQRSVGKRMAGDDGDRVKKVIMAAVESEAAEVAATPENGRNVRLNRAAYKLGGYASQYPGFVDDGDIILVLVGAGTKAGLPYEEVSATVESGFEAGKLHPREIPPPKRERGGHAEPWEGPGISTVIVDAVLASDATLWHNSESEPFITIGKDGHLENHRLGSNASRQWLSQVGYRETERVPGGQSIQDAINVLSGVAGFDGEEHPTYSRLAEHDGAVYIDLGLPDWEAVEVTAAGWSVIPLPPVKFIRSGEMLPMPLPAWCGDWSELRALINAPTDDLWLLTLAWLVQAYWPHGPYAHLVLVGEQGSVKSWMTKVLQRLVDPGKGGVRTKPRDIQSLLIHASWSRVVTIDNFSGVLDGWLSDGLCGLSTGTAAGQRRLYTDYEQAVIEVRRPAIINGIDVVVPRGDLMDRSIFLELPKVEGRKSEAELEAAFLAAWPRIFGLLLDATAEGLKNRGQVTLANPPRMMDFALWVTACEPALPCEPGEIMQYYTQARKDRSLDNVMADAFARAIFQHIRASIPDITAADLLARLSQAEGVAISEPPRGWPRDAARVGTKIRRIAPLLREIGVEISASKSNGRRAFDVVVRDGKGTVRDGKGTVTGTVKTASGGHRDGMDGISVV